MAQIKKPKFDEGAVNAGEERLFKFLEASLPNNYHVIPNLNIAITGQNKTMKFWEYDCIVVAPHAIYHIENKDWGSKIEGDDWAWFRNGQEIANPHKSAGFKSRLLAGKIKNAHPDWQFGQILTAVTLSNPSQSKFGFDPQCECYKQTFTLGNELIEFLTKPENVGCNAGMIIDRQDDITNFLTGQSVEHRNPKREDIFEYHITEVLQETQEFTEYLCVPKLIATARYKIREYPLDKAGKSEKDLHELYLQVQNASMAQMKIGLSPYIVKTDCRMNDEQTYYYEISRYQDECSLRSKLRLKTFKQTDKLNMILDIAAALKIAHDNNVFHRDVCPENIYVYDGNKAALANFRMAWFIEHSELGFTVQSGENLKSPYTAPELLDGDVCKCSDLYSLGVIFYELMTGRPPFDSVLAFTATYGGNLTEDMMPSKVSKDIPEWMDEVVKHTVVSDPDKRWQTAKEFIDYIKNAIETESKSSNVPSGASSDNDSQQMYLKDIKSGMKVSPSMTLYDILGRGSFGKVFKVFHDLQNKYFAIKIFDRDTSVDNAKNEFDALSSLNHPNIVKFIFNDKTQQGLFFTLMELLDGENLQEYTTGDKRLPMEEIYKMSTQVLDALTYMQESQEKPIYHRDIKPSNIMWHKREIYKLIDFNIASTIDDKAFAGTQPFMAPDLIMSNRKIDWDKSADTFALGVTIYELLAHTHPWPGSESRPSIAVEPVDIRKHNDRLTDEMAEFVMKSIVTDRNKRFKTAQEMLAALKDIGINGMLKGTTITRSEKIDDTDPVDYINSLYSQSKHGNSGTRASAKSSLFDKLTYTETKLDKELISDIMALKYKLIIITGNAGDGKTAFIHRIESKGKNKQTLGTKNGSRFIIDNVIFESNYDGSQDEDEKANDSVLTEFLSPFFGMNDYRFAKEGRVIAINEGRLVDFLSTKEELRSLKENIEDYFYKEGHAELMPGLMIINLNLRSVTAKCGDTPSLLAQQVKKLTDPALWGKCSSCPIAERCYIKYNVETFQDSSSGNAVINRLEWLVRTIIYKRELHITMRDLRSMIAWMLTRDNSCEEVKDLVRYVDDMELPELYWQYYYFNLTAPQYDGGIESAMPLLMSQDRLIKLLRETDIAGVALPAFDRDLYYKRKTADKYIIFSDRKQNLLDDFNKETVVIPAYEGKDEDLRQKMIMRHKSFVRHQYFEGTEDFKRRLPYRFASEFEKQMKNENPDELRKTMQILAKAISYSEGCSNDRLTEGFLLLANSNAYDPISKSYRRFPLDDFELYVNKTEHLTKYIEYESDSMTFRNKKDRFVQLTVSLDLYEMLKYIGDGFSPSINDLRGRFIELQIFKNVLESKTYNEILVTKNNRKFTIIRLDVNNRIIVEPLNQQSTLS